MDWRRISLLLLACCGPPSLAQTPGMEGRQVPGNASQEFRDRADAQYRKILLNLAARGVLDDDPAMLKRVRRVSAGLIHAATAVKAQAGAWTWEIHVTSDPRQSAFCMAGGKLLVGGLFVQQLVLDHPELEMLLGQEIAHALAQH